MQGANDRSNRMARRRRFAMIRHRFAHARPRAVHLARRGVSAAAVAARDQKHLLTSLATGAGFGYLSTSRGMTLPFIPALGLNGTYGALFLAGAHFLRNKTLSHAATGLLSIAVSDWARGHAVSGELVGDDIEM